jgi:hypothetical protein
MPIYIFMFWSVKAGGWSYRRMGIVMAVMELFGTISNTSNHMFDSCPFILFRPLQ